jgi:uncharacterized protein YjiS (DUF1127 family)
MAQSVTNFRPVRRVHHARISGFEQGVIAVFNLIHAWAERRQTRRHLYQMPDYILHDIGVSRSEVEGEWSKPFWKA